MTDAVVTIAVPEQLVVDSPTAAVIEVPGAAVTVITTLDTPEILEAGVQGPPGIDGRDGRDGDYASYVHTQSASSSAWVVNHNLGYRPTTSVTTMGGVQVWAEVLHNSTNQLTVYFDSASTGQVTCS